MRLLDTRGATAVEYGLVAGLIALGILSALVMTKSSLNADYNCIASQVGTSGSAACGAPAPAPTTAMDYAVQMVPAGRSITGVTSNAAGPYVWVGYGGDASVKGNNSNLTVRNPSGTYFTFNGTTVAPYVFQIGNYGGAPVQGYTGTTVTYAIVTPKGWILVDTQPSP